MSSATYRLPNTNSYITLSKADDVEYVDPTAFLKKCFRDPIYNGLRINMQLNHPEIPQAIIDKVVSKLADTEGEANFNKVISSKIDDALSDLLHTSNKKDQISILKGIDLTTDKFISFIYYACKKHGFLFSNYFTEYFPSGFNKEDMPKLAFIQEDKSIKKVGNTKWTDGQIKSVINQRSVIVSKFIDKGPIWFCFFINYNSLKGAEAYKNGQTHFHFISHAWGLSREYVLEKLKSKYYKLPSFHLDFKHNT